MNKNNYFVFLLALPVVAMAYSGTTEEVPQSASKSADLMGAEDVHIHAVENPVQPVSRPFNSGDFIERGTTSTGGNMPSEQTGSDTPVAPKRNSSAPTNFPTKPLSPPAPIIYPEPKTENGTAYLCGGVGSDEAEYMKQASRNYDLILTFASGAGNYLANVSVDISNSEGKSILRTICDAPLMLVNLPRTGTYRIHAEADGRTATRTLHVKTEYSGKAVTITWPEK